MTDPAHCAHPHLDYAAPAHRAGWLCTECGGTGPTTVRVEVAPSGRADLVAKCVCMWAMRWPYTATGQEVAEFLAEHANCVPDPPLPVGGSVGLKAADDA